MFSYQEELNEFILREITPQEERLKGLIAESNDPKRTQNKLGILYANYGLEDKARQQFEKAAVGDDYAPALINLGNLYYLDEDYGRAADFFNKAEKLTPDNPRLLLAIARVNHETENFGTARRAYEKLKTIDPNLAERFSYLDLRGEEAVRAAEIGEVTGVVVWDEN